LAVVQNGESIRLLSDVTYSKAMIIDGISVAIDLNGHMLTVNSTADAALTVCNNGELDLIGESEYAKFNVQSSSHGVNAYNGGKAAVSNTTSTGSNYYCCGVRAYDAGSYVAVSGNSISNGNVGRGVHAGNGARVDVYGDAEGGYFGITAIGGSEVNVFGNARGGLYGVNATEQGTTVTVGGNVTGGKTIAVDIVLGNSVTIFNPTGNVTRAETLAIAARIHSIYYTGEAHFTQGYPWYQVYVDYSVASGIIESKDFDDYTLSATRAEIAFIFSRSLPQTEFGNNNTVYSLPDVVNGTPYRDAILSLYIAGILTGNDTDGTFYPANTIIRAEAAAIISRMILPDTRITGKVYNSN